MNSSSRWVREAFEHHKAGRLDAAAPLYRQALTADPRSFDARFLLGTLLLESGKSADACSLLAEAVRLNPDHSRAAAHYALALHEAGRRKEAQSAYRRALTLNADDPNLWFNAGNAALEDGDWADAGARFESALRLQPDFVEARVNLGRACQESGRLAEALQCFQRARRTHPEFFPAVHNEAAALRSLGRTAEAVDAFQAALQLHPRSVETLGNLAVALAELGRLQEAEQFARRALQWTPNDPFCNRCLGKVLHTAGRFEEAIACYDVAQRGLPPDAEIANNLATAYRDLGRIDESLAAYRLAVSLRPDYESALSNLAGVLLELDELDEFSHCCRRIARGRPEAALWDLRAAAACPTLFDSTEQIAEHRTRLAKTLEDFRSAPRRFSLEALVASHCIPSFNLPFHGLDDRPIKELFASVFEPSFEEVHPLAGRGIPKVGFVITHGHETPFVRNMGAFFSRFTSRFQPVVLASAAGQEKIRRVIGDVEFLTLSGDLQQTVDAVRRAKFDLLYFREIGTDSTNYFLPFLRLAPIQCNTYGIQVTSGNRALDYYLSSGLIEPTDAESQYTERLVRLRTLLVCRDPLAPAGRLRPRADFGLREAQHVYLCAQQLGKFHPDFDPWIGRILDADANGVLVITEGTHPPLAEKLKRRFERTLPAVCSRIRFVPQQSGDGYASLLTAADVVLDPPHFGGMNTSYDPLSLGKVVVTLPSNFQRGRYTLGCYRAMGMDEPIADSVEDYLQKAVRIATDADYRRSLESQIRDRRDVLFHNLQAIRELEEFFLETIGAVRSERGPAA